MRSKVLITVILSLFMIIFVPSMVSAESYYVCTTKTIYGAVGYTSYSYSNLAYRYDTETYSATYNEPGTYSYTANATKPKQLPSSFALYKKVKDDLTCSDVYSSIVTFNYDAYTSYMSAGVISANKFDTDKYAKLASGGETAGVKSLPSSNASALEIAGYIKSVIAYGDWGDLLGINKSTLDAWYKMLNSGDDKETNMTYAAYSGLVTCAKNRDMKNMLIFIHSIYSDLMYGEYDSGMVDNNELKYAYLQVPSAKASAQEIRKYVQSDGKYNGYKGVDALTRETKDSWIDTLNKDSSNDNANREINGSISALLSKYAEENEDYKKNNESAVNEKTDSQIKTNEETSKSNTSINNNYKECKDGWWKCAWSFLDDGKNSEHQFGDNVSDSIAGIRSMIFDIGNVIFILVTAFLGVKYIWGGVDSKFSVKNSLVTLVVAAIVFYGWNALADVLDVKELLTGKTSQSGVKGFVGVVYNTVMYIINFAAVGGIIYIGIKYMMAGADGKAEMKLKGIPVVMGIIMVYGTVNLINFILKIVDGL